ncbi:universal stress protein [Spirosoma validum]|uniref:Universal stress protein n=1 Tax=Spirosoma validum TaxID=2771355 RepID=A0A927B6C6_9BACT|nr:universal stress protein [Spirosoma validum]MBD2756529.1 universal stress protein [Spirosoma validum]
MKTIIVATDLSASAHWATDYALELACQLRLRLIVIYAYEVASGDSPDRMSPTDNGEYEQAWGQLSQLRNQMLGTTNHLVDIVIIARPGAPAAILIDEAANQRADLLVMGLVGDEPIKARQVGSLATDMIPNTQVPMLLVPPGAVFQKPQNMVLAIDLSSPIDAVSIDMALGFAQRLHVSLDVVCLDDKPGELQQNAARHIRNLLRNQPHTFSFLPGYDVALALEDYLAHHKADIIILLPKPHSRLRTWLLESNTQEVARLATIPVLAAV